MMFVKLKEDDCNYVGLLFGDYYVENPAGYNKDTLFIRIGKILWLNEKCHYSMLWNYD